MYKPNTKRKVINIVINMYLDLFIFILYVCILPTHVSV